MRIPKWITIGDDDGYGEPTTWHFTPKWLVCNRLAVWNRRRKIHAVTEDVHDRVVDMSSVITELDPDLTQFATLMTKLAAKGPGITWIEREDWDWPEAPKWPKS